MRFQSSKVLFFNILKKKNIHLELWAKIVLSFQFVCFDHKLRLSQQFFSHVATARPGLNEYKAADKMISLVRISLASYLRHVSW